jgi:hypothetical protein
MSTSRAIAVAILGLSGLASLFCLGAVRANYTFAYPFAATAYAGFLVGLVAVVSNSRWALLVQAAVALLSAFFCLIAFAGWPNGDDGPKMIMIVVMGPGMLASVGLSILSIVLTLFDPPP